MFALLVAFVLALPIESTRKVSEQVDLIELNHVYSKRGKHVYTQYIFYAWHAASGKYHVRDYLLVSGRKYDELTYTWETAAGLKAASHSWDVHAVMWHDEQSDLIRRVTSPVYRETWTQTDPERANTMILHQLNRIALQQPPATEHRTK